MARLKELISPEQLLRRSNDVQNYARKLAALGLTSEAQRIGLDTFMDRLRPEFQACGNLPISRKAEAIINDADWLSPDVISEIARAAKDTVRNGRRKIGNFGRGKQVLSRLQDETARKKASANFPTAEGREFRSIKDYWPVQNPPVTPDEDFARRQRETVIIAAELLADGVPQNQVEFTLRRLKEERIPKQTPITVFEAPKNYL